MDFATIMEFIQANIEPAIIAASPLIVAIYGLCAKLKHKKEEAVKGESQAVMFDFLSKIANREDVRPLIDVLNKSNDQVKILLLGLAEEFNVAFSNSDLPEDVKVKLQDIFTRVSYGLDTTVIDKLQAEIAMLKQALSDAHAEAEKLKDDKDKALLTADDEPTRIRS